jgi:hypothetical protein
MDLKTDLLGQTFKNTIYDSVIGKIEIETEILIDGSITSTMWVVYPDGFADEVFTIQEAESKLEL